MPTSASSSWRRCGFGRADVVVAVPACWLDVRRMSDLEEMALSYRRTHGRQVRVATKYMNMTRRFFTRHGVTGYRIVESLGATEGAPAAGLAELIVDITTTGATLRANGLKVLDDGVILESQANLIASKAAAWSPDLDRLARSIAARLGAEADPREPIPRNRLAAVRTAAAAEYSQCAWHQASIRCDEDDTQGPAHAIPQDHSRSRASSPASR